MQYRFATIKTLYLIKFLPTSLVVSLKGTINIELSFENTFAANYSYVSEKDSESASVVGNESPQLIFHGIEQITIM